MKTIESLERRQQALWPKTEKIKPFQSFDNEVVMVQNKPKYPVKDIQRHYTVQT